MPYRARSVRSRARRRPGRSWFCRKWDDLRLVGLKLIFLVVSGVMSLLGLSRRESWWKDAEILMLRHQLAVALRERPKVRAQLTWPDRAWLALLAGTVPPGALPGCGCSSLRAPSCAGIGTSSAAGGGGCRAAGPGGPSLLVPVRQGQRWRLRAGPFRIALEHRAGDLVAGQMFHHLRVIR